MENIDKAKISLVHNYDLLTQKSTKLYLAGKQRGRKAMTAALEKAQQQMTAAGEITAAQGRDLKRYLARDLDQTIKDATRSGKENKQRAHPSRLSAGLYSSLATVLNSSGDALHWLGRMTQKKLAYKTGEITSAGTLTCQTCRHKIHLKATKKIPPCSKCSATLFHKSY